MVMLLDISEILNLINILLGFLLALLAVKYMRFYGQLGAWWRRLLVLTFIFILGKVVSFIEEPFLEIVMDTIFIGYFIYFLSYITTVVKEIDSAKTEMASLRDRLGEIKLKEADEE
jgi:uncharacterized membrane protein (DUF106 family)